MPSRKRKARRSAQGTPALPSERIRGSEKNPPKSAASNSAASSISLTAELEAALKRKVQEHNDAMRGRNASAHQMASLPMLKAVLRRGMGAFSVSHRPNVSSRQQWGMARVNAFLRILSSGKPADAKYISDNDLLPSGHPRSTRKRRVEKKSLLLHGATYDVERTWMGPEIDVKVDFGLTRRLRASYNPKARPRARRLISVPFDARARDGDGDRIVQEGTIWERPAGTRWVTAAGEPIEEALPKMTAGRRGPNLVKPAEEGKEKERPAVVPAHMYHPSMRLVDKDGNDVDYVPTWARSGISYRTRRLGETIGTRIGQRPNEREADRKARAARRDVSTPHRMSRFDKKERSLMEKIFIKGRSPKMVREDPKDPNSRKVPRERPGSKYDMETSIGRMGKILDIVRGNDEYRSVWDSGRDWYEQQHYAMRGVAERTKTDFHVAVAVLAATSPRNPWDAWTNSKRRIRELAEKENISLEAAAKRLKADLFATPNIDVAEYLLQNWESMRDEDFTLDADSVATLKKGLSKTEKAAFEESLAGNKPIIRKISNLSGSTGAPTDLDYALAGLIMAGRAHEAQDHTTTYLSDMVATALAVIDGGPEKIDSTLTGPKVRSFYDNIAFFNESDAVTIDSIMAQLATGLPAWEAGELLKASQGTYVIDKFGNKVADPYPVYAVIAEIVHEVTDRWNAAHPDDILSHTDVQAILWYVQRERDDILQLLNED